MTRKSQKWLEMWGHVSQTLACITNGKYWRRQDAKGILRRLVSQFAVHLVTFVMQNTKPWLTSTEWMAIYGGPQGTTLLLENVVSFCKNTTVIFRIEHLSLEFCNRSL